MSDERVLGDNCFVEKVLDKNQETLERRYVLKPRGIGLDALALHVAQFFDMPPEDL